NRLYPTSGAGRPETGGGSSHRLYRIPHEASWRPPHQHHNHARRGRQWRRHRPSTPGSRTDTWTEYLDAIRRLVAGWQGGNPGSRVGEPGEWKVGRTAQDVSLYGGRLAIRYVLIRLARRQ